MTFRDVSNYQVQLVWEKAVAFQSAMRLVGIAKASGKAFQILGEPKGIFTPMISEGEVVDVEEEGVEE